MCRWTAPPVRRIVATYPPPYMPGYYAPTYAPPPAKPKTAQGVRWSVIAFLLYIGYLATSAVIGLVFASILGGLSSGGLPGAVSALLLALLVALIAVVFGILVLVFYFIGLGYLYGGRNEFGPAHARNVRLSLYLVITAIAVFVAGGVASFIISFSSFTFGSPQINAGAIYLSVAVGAVVGVVVAALVAAALVLSARALARPDHHTLLYAAAGLGTATPGIVGAVTLFLLADYIRAIQSLQGGFGAPSFDPGLGYPSVVGAVLGLITFVLYLLVYRDIGARLRSGTLNPVLPPPMPMGSWMTAPMVPSYPPPAAPPPVPPAQPSPPGPSP